MDNNYHRIPEMGAEYNSPTATVVAGCSMQHYCAMSC